MIKLAIVGAILLPSLSACDTAGNVAYAVVDEILRTADYSPDPFAFDPKFGPPGATLNGECPCPPPSEPTVSE